MSSLTNPGRFSSVRETSRRFAALGGMCRFSRFRCANVLRLIRSRRARTAGRRHVVHHGSASRLTFGVVNEQKQIWHNYLARMSET